MPTRGENGAAFPRGRTLHVHEAYALFGALIGIGLPVAATLIEAVTRHGRISAVGAAQQSPALWIIDTAPLFLGLFAGFAGWQQDRNIALEADRRGQVTKTAQELFATAQTLLSTVSSFSSMTSETAASVRETTATMGSSATPPPRPP